MSVCECDDISRVLPQALALQAKGTLAKHFGKLLYAVNNCTNTHSVSPSPSP